MIHHWNTVVLFQHKLLEKYHQKLLRFQAQNCKKLQCRFRKGQSSLVNTKIFRHGLSNLLTLNLLLAFSSLLSSVNKLSKIIPNLKE